jgi:hypothetical protein
MNILPWVITYNAVDRDEMLELAAAFLMGDPPRAFGSAVKEIELNVCVKCRSTRSRTPVGKQRRNYVKGLRAPAEVQFLRRSAKLNITYVTNSKFEQYSVQVFGTNKYEKERRIVRSAPSFRAACEEMASNLRLAGTKFKKSDDFKWDTFSAHLEQRLAKLPKSRSELRRLAKKLKSPFERMGTSKPEDSEPSERALKRKPKLITINHDDDCASHIGRTADGRQFFLTTPFIPAQREFVALYLFDSEGKFQKAYIDDLGKREELKPERAREAFERRFAQLGPVKLGRIRVEPFTIKRFGREFGLVPRLLEDEDDEWTVEAHPGNYMAFFKPWNWGEYDT